MEDTNERVKDDLEDEKAPQKWRTDASDTAVNIALGSFISEFNYM